MSEEILEKDKSIILNYLQVNKILNEGNTNLDNMRFAIINRLDNTQKYIKNILDTYNNNPKYAEYKVHLSQNAAYSQAQSILDQLKMLSVKLNKPSLTDERAHSK